jgi:hypothetical protein
MGVQYQNVACNRAKLVAARLGTRASLGRRASRPLLRETKLKTQAGRPRSQDPTGPATTPMSFAPVAVALIFQISPDQEFPHWNDFSRISPVPANRKQKHKACFSRRRHPISIRNQLGSRRPVCDGYKQLHEGAAAAIHNREGAGCSTLLPHKLPKPCNDVRLCVTRGLDPRVHLLRKKMDCRVKPSNDADFYDAVASTSAGWGVRSGKWNLGSSCRATTVLGSGFSDRLE